MMSETTITFLVMLFIFTLLFLTFVLSPKFSRRNQCFGITLSEDLQKHLIVQGITRQFYIRSIVVFIVSVVGSSLMFIGASLGYLVGYHLIHGQYFQILFILLIYLVIGSYFALYVRTHNKIKAFKGTLKQQPTPPSKMLIDTHFIEEKQRLKNIFKLLFLLPLLFTVGVALYVLYNYSSIPDPVPTHWNLLGQVDSWQPKSLITLIMPCIFPPFIIMILYFSTTSLFNIRGRLHPKKLETNKKELLNYFKYQALSIYFFTLFICVLFASISLATLKGGALNLLSILCFSSLFIVGLVLMLYTNFKYNRLSSSSKDSKEETYNYAPEEDDNLWLWGTLYNNPNDPSLFVEKRYGIGWTLNIGHKKGKLLAAVLLLFISFSLLLPLILK